MVYFSKTVLCLDGMSRIILINDRRRDLFLFSQSFRSVECYSKGSAFTLAFLVAYRVLVFWNHIVLGVHLPILGAKTQNLRWILKNFKLWFYEVKNVFLRKIFPFLKRKVDIIGDSAIARRVPLITISWSLPN